MPCILEKIHFFCPRSKQIYLFDQHAKTWVKIISIFFLEKRNSFTLHRSNYSKSTALKEKQLKNHIYFMNMKGISVKINKAINTKNCYWTTNFISQLTIKFAMLISTALNWPIKESILGWATFNKSQKFF